MSELNKLIDDYCNQSNDEIRKFSCLFCRDATNRMYKDEKINRIPQMCEYCLIPSHLCNTTNNCLSHFVYEEDDRDNWSEETIEFIKMVLKMNKE